MPGCSVGTSVGALRSNLDVASPRSGTWRAQSEAGNRPSLRLDANESPTGRGCGQQHGDSSIRRGTMGRPSRHSGHESQAMAPWQDRLRPGRIPAGRGRHQGRSSGIRGQARKLVVLDLDDTLWGGVVGDIGWDTSEPRGPQPDRRSLQRVSARVEAIDASRRRTGHRQQEHEAIALEAIDQHPEMVLRRNDFAAWRINWNDKVANIV